MRNRTAALIMTLAFAALVMAVGCSGAKAEPLEVTYYYLPGWPICAKVQLAVSELDEEFAGKVRAENVDATTPESAAICKDLGFGNHGLVIRSADGSTLWSQPDHEVNMDDVKAELTRRLGG